MLLLKKPPTSTAILLPINLPEIAIGKFDGSSTSGWSEYSDTIANEFDMR